MYGGLEILLRSFLTSALDEDKLSASLPGCFTAEERVSGSEDRRLGGPQNRFGITLPSRNRNPVIQRVAWSLYLLILVPTRLWNRFN
jgi:hypothetical protein